MNELNLFKARSFWLTALAVTAGVTQTGATGDPNSIDPAGLIGMVGNVLESTGVVPHGAAFAKAVTPTVVAGLGLWAYIERIKGKKKLVLGKARQ